MSRTTHYAAFSCLVFGLVVLLNPLAANAKRPSTATAKSYNSTGKQTRRIEKGRAKLAKPAMICYDGCDFRFEFDCGVCGTYDNNGQITLAETNCDAAAGCDHTANAIANRATGVLVSEPVTVGRLTKSAHVYKPLHVSLPHATKQFPKFAAMQSGR
jgi:hypothetical protein